MSDSGTIMSIIRTPLAIVLLLVILLVMAGLTIAAGISGELTAAAVGAAGFITIIVLLVVIGAAGKK